MKTALVSIAKDEDNYLKEWVEYHLKIGFDDVYVFQNNWRYTRGDITNEKFHLEILDGECKQNECYNNFILNYYDKFDWIAFFDIDEFLYIRDARSVNEILSDYEDIDSLFINWRLFGDSGLKEVENDEYSVLKRFTRCDKDLHSLGKQILHTSRTKTTVKFNNPHILQYSKPPLREFRSYDPSLKLMCMCGNIKNNTELEKMELYHYRNKTYQECYKRKYKTTDAFFRQDNCTSRSDLNEVNRYFNEHNKNDIENTTLKDFLG